MCSRCSGPAVLAVECDTNANLISSMGSKQATGAGRRAPSMEHRVGGEGAEVRQAEAGQSMRRPILLTEDDDDCSVVHVARPWPPPDPGTVTGRARMRRVRAREQRGQGTSTGPPATEPPLSAVAADTLLAMRRVMRALRQQRNAGMAREVGDLSQERTRRSETVVDLTSSPGPEADVEQPAKKRQRRGPPQAPPVDDTQSFSMTCPICLESVKQPSSTVCGHIFCLTCIRNTLAVLGRCPTCRARIRSTQVHRIYIGR